MQQEIEVRVQGVVTGTFRPDVCRQANKLIMREVKVRDRSLMSLQTVEMAIVIEKITQLAIVPPIREVLAIETLLILI